ncbi:MAG: Lar family restriction alleviation protein [Cupriavidus sp.]|uniref:Lar family restriction alleviation protein n=2 Tax=Cupriavidus sp. TaxID=1873897 RepID=UPI002A584906|nr:Lar family restriction alleviation protein [Cupriavidus sp.]MCA3190960.1 Lar family restriction alleviation protein [Cupriavidus sp.]MCA3199304.1 Lar family restriction alleviation protein [Cupriavidus sp.]MCA3204571.1 Lar family restriction alleviation protein [Cupriavidus sp.]MCA3207730.1 Lar family restriction alleviation protein [Cupriavidus sp.]
MKPITLLPCPFCGLPGQMKTSQRWSAASCTDVACCGHQIALTHKSEETAAAAWNYRSPTLVETEARTIR